jgi:hypothetical protein
VAGGGFFAGVAEHVGNMSATNGVMFGAAGLAAVGSIMTLRHAASEFKNGNKVSAGMNALHGAIQMGVGGLGMVSAATGSIGLVGGLVGSIGGVMSVAGGLKDGAQAVSEFVQGNRQEAAAKFGAGVVKAAAGYAGFALAGMAATAGVLGMGGVAAAVVVAVGASIVADKLAERVEHGIKHRMGKGEHESTAESAGHAQASEHKSAAAPSQDWKARLAAKSEKIAASAEAGEPTNAGARFKATVSHAISASAEAIEKVNPLAARRALRQSQEAPAHEVVKPRALHA